MWKQRKRKNCWGLIRDCSEHCFPTGVFVVKTVFPTQKTEQREIKIQAQIAKPGSVGCERVEERLFGDQIQSSLTGG